MSNRCNAPSPTARLQDRTAEPDLPHPREQLLKYAVILTQVERPASTTGDETWAVLRHQPLGLHQARSVREASANRAESRIADRWCRRIA